MGPRFLLPMLIALPLGLAAFCDMKASPYAWRLVVVLGTLSIALSFPVSLADPHIPTIHTDAEFSALQIGDEVEVPALEVVAAFYSLALHRKADGSFDPAAAMVVFPAYGIPLILIGWAIRSRQLRQAVGQDESVAE